MSLSKSLSGNALFIKSHFSTTVENNAGKNLIFTVLIDDCKNDGVVKTLHLVRCYNFPIITTYRMYAEIIGKLHASNMKLFTYPSEIEVFTSLSRMA